MNHVATGFFLLNKGFKIVVCKTQLWVFFLVTDSKPFFFPNDVYTVHAMHGNKLVFFLKKQ